VADRRRGRRWRAPPPSFSFLPSHFSFSLFLFLFSHFFSPFLFFFFLFSFPSSFLPPLPRPRSWPLPRTPHRPAPLGLPPNARARSQPVHHPCPRRRHDTAACSRATPPAPRHAARPAEPVRARGPRARSAAVTPAAASLAAPAHHRLAACATPLRSAPLARTRARSTGLWANASGRSDVSSAEPTCAPGRAARRPPLPRTAPPCAHRCRTRPVIPAQPRCPCAAPRRASAAERH